jgi:hypothetical protein
VPLANLQAGLFQSVPDLPQGMRYVPNLLSAIEECALLAHLPGLPFKEFEFHPFWASAAPFPVAGIMISTAVVETSWRTPRIPLAASSAGGGFRRPRAAALEHALVIEYRLGAGIRCHRDRPQFGGVVGLSLLAPCTFRLRRKAGSSWECRSLTAEPRSAYLLRRLSHT